MNFIHEGFAGVGKAGESMGHTGLILTIIGIAVVLIAIVVLTIVSKWKIYKKAGVPGWAALVPYYDVVKLLEINKQPLWWAFMLLIPIVNIFFAIKLYRRWAAVFGKGAWFTVGMIFLPFIFWPILAFGKSKYSAKAFPEPKPLSEAGKYGLMTAALGTAFTLLYMMPMGMTPTSLSIISETGGYATDGSYVYLYDHIIRGADPHSFEVVGGYYAKDWHAVYYDGKKVLDADPDTFEELQGSYAKDESHAYYGGDIIKDADAATFELVEDDNGEYGKDVTGVYYYGKKINGVDLKTFELLRYGYQKDAFHVYYDGDLIKGADAATFKVREDASELFDAYDKNHDYNYGEVVEVEA